MRSASSRAAAAASDSRLESSTTAYGSTNSVCPELDASWTMPGDLPPLGHTHRQDRAAASLGEERLLERTGDGVRPCDARELLADTRGTFRSSARSRRRRGDAESPQIGAVLLDRTVDGSRQRTRARRQRTSEACSSGASEAASPTVRLASSATRIARAQARSSPRMAGRLRAPHARRGPRTSAMPASEGSAAACSRANGLGGQRLAAGDLDRIRRRLERTSGRRSVFRLGSRREALDDRRQPSAASACAFTAPV